MGGLEPTVDEDTEYHDEEGYAIEKFRQSSRRGGRGPGDRRRSHRDFGLEDDYGGRDRPESMRPTRVISGVLPGPVAMPAPLPEGEEYDEPSQYDIDDGWDVEYDERGNLVRGRERPRLGRDQRRSHCDLHSASDAYERDRPERMMRTRGVPAPVPMPPALHEGSEYDAA